MMGLFVILSCPENRLCGMGEAAAGQVRRRIGFLPGYVIDNFIAFLLQGQADGINIMKRTGNPYGAVRLQNLFTQAQPFPVKGCLLYTSRCV